MGTGEGGVKREKRGEWGEEEVREEGKRRGDGEMGRKANGRRREEAG